MTARTGTEQGGGAQRRTKDARVLASLAMAATLALTAGLTACGKRHADDARAPAGVTPPSTDKSPEFSFDSLDARAVSSDAFRGRPTVLAFVTTWDIASQAQLGYLVSMAQSDGERVQYAVVALQPRTDRELVELYREKLGITFPVALGSDDGNIGELGVVEALPTVILLDRRGRVAFRRAGVSRAEVLRDAMKSL
jgi:thiol-disulfide isomerase/thioredoxin